MNKKEVLELKRRFKKDEATFTQLVGCYVDCNKNKICKFGGKFLNLEEEEFHKYLEIANKFNLLVSGGSDFHGRNKPYIDLGVGRGNLNVPDEIWKNLNIR